VKRRRALASLVAFVAMGAARGVHAADDEASLLTSIAVLDFELNDLTLQPNNAAEVARTASIKPMLEDVLGATPGLRVVPVSTEMQRSADRGFGYLFDRGDAAAALGREVGADWIAVGRVHKASFLFVYFKLHLVDARSGELAADLVVEVKGPQQQLTRRGVESLARQIVAAIEQRSSSNR
jgi:hypothetical protein